MADHNDNNDYSNHNYNDNKYNNNNNSNNYNDYNYNNTSEDENGIYFYPEDEPDTTEDTISTNNTKERLDTIDADELDLKKEQAAKKTGEVTVLGELLSYVKIVLCAVAIAFIFTQFIIVNAQVPTGSMVDTINIGDRLIGFRLSFLFNDPQRGDIVIFKFPDDESQNYVKRVIGLPGDVIQIKNGQVSVNGEQLEEDYLLEPMIPRAEEEVYVVPEDSYFMMGDNRNSSLDSRAWVNKYVKKDKILAKVIFRYYNGDTKRIGFSFVK